MSLTDLQNLSKKSAEKFYHDDTMLTRAALKVLRDIIARIRNNFATDIEKMVDNVDIRNWIDLATPIEKPILDKLIEMNLKIVIIHIGYHSIKFAIPEPNIPLAGSMNVVNNQRVEYTVTVFQEKFEDQYTEETFVEKIEPEKEEKDENHIRKGMLETLRHLAVRGFAEPMWIMDYEKLSIEKLKILLDDAIQKRMRFLTENYTDTMYKHNEYFYS